MTNACSRTKPLATLLVGPLMRGVMRVDRVAQHATLLQ